MTAILFVCTGNICRSSTAEGVFRRMLQERGLEEEFQIASAGMIDYHEGEPPDPRSQQTALAHGVNISGQRASRVKPADFERFDYLLAMDHGHEQQLRAMVPVHLHHKIRLFLSFLGDPERLEVHDPYYGTAEDFELAYRYVADGCRALLAALES